MPVTIDNTPLDTAHLDLGTIGDVLSYLREQGRIAVELTLDGQPPDMVDLDALHARSLDAHDLKVESADPREMAMDALTEMEQTLSLTDQMQRDASDLLQRNQIPPAMKKLSDCLTTWQQAQQCVTQSAALLGMDLKDVRAGELPIEEVARRFSEQLRQIRTALESQDYVLLSDILTYELSETGEHWRQAILSLCTDIATGSS